MKRLGIAAATLAVCTLCACGPQPGASTSPTTSATGSVTPSQTSTQESPVETASPNPTPDARIDEAKADLATRAGTTADQVSVVVHEQVTWPDGSMGCPQPDRMYTQALRPGERLVLSAGGKEYAYHAGVGTAFRYCENPGKHYPADKSGR